MGLLAKKTLNCNGFKDLHAIVNTGSTPPLSCVVDGIQVATGCTLGKGNITVRDCDSISAIFHSGNRRIRVEIKADALRSLRKELVDGDADSLKETARKFCSMPEPNLFSVEEYR
jgi:pyrimidine-specific ribonucleoside hydrolase